MEGTLFLKRGGNIEDVESYSNEEQKQTILAQWNSFYGNEFLNFVIEDEVFEHKKRCGGGRKKEKDENGMKFLPKKSPFKKGPLPKTVKINRSRTRPKSTNGGFIW